MKGPATLHRIVLRADQALHLGTGRGSGFSGVTHQHVPGSTLRGALCAAWWRDHPAANQPDFDARIVSISFGDAIPSPGPGTTGPLPMPVSAALDRRTCKYPQVDCPRTGHPWTVQDCPDCGGRTEPAKGERVVSASADVRVSAATRVALTPHEQARDDMLFERQGLVVGDDTCLVAPAAGDIGWLVKPGQVIRVGAAGTVAGRMTVVAVEPVETPTLALDAGENQVRVELMTPGVYVDDFGFAIDRPTPDDVRWAFRLPGDTRVDVERAFIRWTTASGWHTAANRPKPEDAAVIAHSCFHIRLSLATPVTAPTLVHDLGVRTGEGYGWARLQPLAVPPEEPRQQRTEVPERAEVHANA